MQYVKSFGLIRREGHDASGRRARIHARSFHQTLLYAEIAAASHHAHASVVAYRSRFDTLNLHFSPSARRVSQREHGFEAEYHQRLRLLAFVLFFIRRADFLLRFGGQEESFRRWGHHDRRHDAGHTGAMLRMHGHFSKF